MEWISVEDRLPEPKHIDLKTQFLIKGYFHFDYCMGKVFYQALKLQDFYYKEGPRFDSNMHYVVTHWKEIT